MLILAPHATLKLIGRSSEEQSRACYERSNDGPIRHSSTSVSPHQDQEKACSRRGHTGASLAQFGKRATIEGPEVEERATIARLKLIPLSICPIQVLQRTGPPTSPLQWENEFVVVPKQAALAAPSPQLSHLSALWLRSPSHTASNGARSSPPTT